jgi:hypothetical protein
MISDQGYSALKRLSIGKGPRSKHTNSLEPPRIRDLTFWEIVKHLPSTDFPNPQGLDAIFHKSTLDKLFRGVDNLRRARSDISSISIHANHTKSNVSRHPKYSRSYNSSQDVVRRSNNRSYRQEQRVRQCSHGARSLSISYADSILRLSVPRTFESKFKRYLSEVRNQAEDDFLSDTSKQMSQDRRNATPMKRTSLFPYRNDREGILPPKGTRVSPKNRLLESAIKSVISRIVDLTRSGWPNDAKSKTMNSDITRNPLGLSSPPMEIPAWSDTRSNMHFHQIISDRLQTKPTRRNLLRLCQFLKGIERSRIK